MWAGPRRRRSRHLPSTSRSSACRSTVDGRERHLLDGVDRHRRRAAVRHLSPERLEQIVVLAQIRLVADAARDLLRQGLRHSRHQLPVAARPARVARLRAAASERCRGAVRAGAERRAWAATTIVVSNGGWPAIAKKRAPEAPANVSAASAGCAGGRRYARQALAEAELGRAGHAAGVGRARRSRRRRGRCSGCMTIPRRSPPARCSCVRPSRRRWRRRHRSLRLRRPR